MEKIVNLLTCYVIENSKFNEEDYVILKYGFQIGLEMLSCIAVYIFLSYIIHMCAESLILLGVFIVLRSYGGGIHLNRFVSCAICSNLVMIGILLLTKYYIFPIEMSIMLGIICSIYIYYLGPVESKNKKLDEIEKKHYQKKLRARIIGVSIFTFIVCISGNYTYVTVIYLGLFAIMCSMILGKASL